MSVFEKDYICLRGNWFVIFGQTFIDKNFDETINCIRIFINGWSKINYNDSLFACFVCSNRCVGYVNYLVFMFFLLKHLIF